MLLQYIRQIDLAKLSQPNILLLMSVTKLLVICITILLASCTMTTTKTKDPDFSNRNKIQNELVAIVNAENFNLNGKEITTNKKTTSELEIAIINGDDIPTRDEERKALGKSIATTIKRNLKNPDEFDKYTILFVTETKNGASTNRKWTGNVFNSTEL